MTDKLARIRADRLARDGQPDPDPEHVRRDAEASHRLAHGNTGRLGEHTYEARTSDDLLELVQAVEGCDCRDCRTWRTRQKIREQRG